uniref:Zinc finger matrin-type protein 5 n=1 Tax=Monodelphis domestica TaxID=13616 RepID=A0A5F8HID0_MONDO
MGKRYFCDYCDRSFQDNLHNRKKHLNGVQHLRAKKVWYDLFRDAAAILVEEQNKRPCRKFLETGQCDFDSNCRFSHMTSGDLELLAAQVHEERLSREQDVVEVPEGGIEDWLEKRAKQRSSAQSSRYHARVRALSPSSPQHPCVPRGEAWQQGREIRHTHTSNQPLGVRGDSGPEEPQEGVELSPPGFLQWGGVTHPWRQNRMMGKGKQSWGSGAFPGTKPATGSGPVPLGGGSPWGGPSLYEAQSHPHIE